MNPQELAYYRAVEDLFARLRGTPFLLTPKDFALLKRWWVEGVPLAAVVAGLGEAFAGRRERGEDPVSSLSYCRHAVARAAKRLAPGTRAREGAPPTVNVEEALRALADDIGALAERWRAERAEWAAALETLRDAMIGLPHGRPAADIAETLGRLEVAMLDVLAGCAPAHVAEQVEAALRAELQGLELPEEARARTERALRLRLWRETVGLPRLELTGADR
jgi:hypothetical protein